MGAWWQRLSVFVAACVLLWVAPLVRIVPLDEQAAAEPTAFDADAFAERFWSERLPGALDAAPDVDAVLGLLASDPAAARETYGHATGVGRTFFVMLSGEGTVSETTPKGVLVTTPAGERVLLRTGPVFGSTVRDASGLIDYAAAPNSRDFNAISDALNRLTEDRVIPTLESSSPGERLRFVCCAKVKGQAAADQPLEAVPLRVEAL